MCRLVLLVFLGVIRIPAEDLARLIPFETESAAGVEVSRLRTSPRWPLLLEIARLWRRFEDTSAAAGFDPAADLEELALLRMGGPAPGELVVLRGRFDVSRIAHFDPANEEGHELRYRGIRVFAPPSETGGYHQWTASIDDLVVIGPAGCVQAAIDTYVAAKPRHAWFVATLTRVRGRYDAWTAGPASLSSPEWSGGIRLDAKPWAEGEAIAPSPELARALAGALRDSLAKGWRGEASRLWKMAADSARISLDQRVVRVSAEMDWEPLLVLAAGIARF
jgi:hypothetical protein